MRIGFIGLGNMGAPMARNLAAAGHSITGYDLRPVEVEGVGRAESLEEAVRERDVVFTMLPDGAVVREVSAEIAGIARAGTCLVDCSTIDMDNACCPLPGIGPTSPADTGYAPGFAAELMLKDMQLSQQAARTADARTALTARATEIYESFVDGGGRGRDFSGLYPWIRANGHETP
jgi:3-hydroxyisobutyrate dehydrogenase-like beta-hydroxyacid dehydrogenase